MEVLWLFTDCGITYVVLSVLLIFLNVREVKRTSNLKSAPLWLVPALVTIYLLIPLGIVMLIILYIYRHLLGIILKIKHGSKFGGFLETSDSSHALKGKADHVITIILMIKCSKKTSPEDLLNKVKYLARKLHREYTKYNSKFFTFGGYCYMLKQQVNVDSCVRVLRILGDKKDTISKSDYLSLLNECCNFDLPEDNTVPWELVVGTQNVNWRNDEYCYYPVFCRNGHAVADGVTVSEIILKTFTDPKETKILVKPAAKPAVRMRKMLMTLLSNFSMLVLFPAYYLSIFVIKAKDHNLLVGSKLCEQAFHCINIEENPGYVQKIKEVKNAIPGFSFTDVVLAAFSASLNDYFLKNSVKIEYVSLGVPVTLDASKLQRVPPEQLHITDADIKNKFSFIIVNTPVFVGYENNGVNEIVRRLKLVREQSFVLKNSLEYQVLNMSLNLICPYLPLKVNEFFMKTGKCTAMFSVVPGSPIINCWQNFAEVADAVGFTPHGMFIGASILVSTYDSRLQIGMSVDKNLISCQEDVQQLADNVLKHIDRFYKHVESLKLVNWNE